MKKRSKHAARRPRSQLRVAAGPKQAQAAESPLPQSNERQADGEVLWGKQTQASLRYFNIGEHRFSPRFIAVLVTIKRACAQVNRQHRRLTAEHCDAIVWACDAILAGDHGAQFPLRIWQTGSGTQTNMNVNEVIASLANSYLAESGQGGAQPESIHPNDHVNRSQSSNDVFPCAMHILVATQTQQQLLPALALMDRVLSQKQAEFHEIYSVGRTHLMDALPIRSGAILSAYLSQLTAARNAIEQSLEAVYSLALGGTAVGSGANAPAQFGQQVIALLAAHYQLPFSQHPNLYAAVSSEDALLRYSAALKQLAASLQKMANDFRLLGSGPRCGFNEWHLPANEPGSSIMPGKVNPTQCEALSMVCLQIFGNDLTVALAVSSGQLQLNTYRPVILHNLLESIDLLSDAMNAFSEHCIDGFTLNQAQIDLNMRNNLSVITLLTPELGYDVAAEIARTAQLKNLPLSAAAEILGLYTQEQFELLLLESLNRHFSAIK
ncbi:fumarase, class II [Ferrimonas sediminum]|uniref:fumarate hydratase n=1 Tax=Ferrimonas sediminum TaxID=718193 RepID=A0A1G8RKN9_9GAMM|nr:class II fumarate hydratase [Ferrimonas sediminum]SDJ17482.1 fumarase, class II [Ferrimonas sediminum]